MSASDITLSVLMPVYIGANPIHVRQALDSVIAQTRVPEEIVVVVDGPVTAEHDEVLLSFADQICRVDLPDNVGLGRALAVGLGECRGALVARADADDVNEPQRFERQLAILAASRADVCSAAMMEVSGDPPRNVGIRGCPTEHQGIARRMKSRNPVNHPTVVFRRESAEKAGGYQHLPLLEDYDLWARMLAMGAVFVGTEEPLVRFRVDGMLERRTGSQFIVAERELQSRLHAYGVVSRPRQTFNLVLRGAYRRLPRWALTRAYSWLFARSENQALHGRWRS